MQIEPTLNRLTNHTPAEMRELATAWVSADAFQAEHFARILQAEADGYTAAKRARERVASEERPR